MAIKLGCFAKEDDMNPPKPSPKSEAPKMYYITMGWGPPQYETEAEAVEAAHRSLAKYLVPGNQIWPTYHVVKLMAEVKAKPVEVQVVHYDEKRWATGAANAITLPKLPS